MAREAAAGSCVTMMTVRPSRRSLPRTSSTCSRVSGSRLPVGSSARITAGLLASVRAERDALLLADAEFARLVMDAIVEADAGQQFRTRDSCSADRRREHQRNLHVLQRRTGTAPG